MRVQKEDLLEIEFTLNRGDKASAVKQAESVLKNYFLDTHEAGGTWDYMEEDFQDFPKIIDRVRTECFVECQQSKSEVLRFKLGDRIYGFNGDEMAALFILSPLIGELNLIIDHLNDYYRLNLLEYSDENLTINYKLLPLEKQRQLIEGYIDCYKAIPKLNSLPRYPLGEDSDSESDVDEHSETSNSNDNLETPVEVNMINRACKAGLLKTLLDGNTIHFNIDRYLNDEDFISQPPNKLDKRKSSNPIRGFYTAKELRFVKRLSDSYPDLVKNLKFYHQGEEVPAPWLVHTKEWANYRPKSYQNIESTMKALSGTLSISPTIRENAQKLLSNVIQTLEAIGELTDVRQENSCVP